MALKKIADSAFWRKKDLSLKYYIIRAKAKRTKFEDHQRKIIDLTENFNFWSCDPEKIADSAMSQKQ